MLSDKLESFELDTNVFVDFSNETGKNLLVAIEKINQAKTSIDLSFRTPSNFEKSKHFQEFQDSLKSAHYRGVKIRVYTQNQSYTAPYNIETKYFPRTDFKFYVNLMIVDGKDVLIPSSFIPEFTGSDTRINYYVYVNELGINAQIFFDYIWNLPKSGSYSVAKRYWAVTRQWTKDKINITLDPTDYFPLNKSSMPSNVKNLITSGSNEKIYFLSERFFPENTESDDLDEMEDIPVKEVLVTDDIASAPKGSENKRRGVAGLVFAYKCAGAAAEKMYNLDEVARIAQKTVDNTRTMGVALTPCIVPEAGKATFSIAEDEMEIGMGIHGEPGIHRTKLMKIDDVVSNIMEKILEDLPFEDGCEVAVLVNGLGGTPKEELYLAYRKLYQILSDKNISIHRKYIGEYATSLEMAGMSISLLKLDDELKEMIDAPCYSPFFEQNH